MFLVYFKRKMYRTGTETKNLTSAIKHDRIRRCSLYFSLRSSIAWQVFRLTSIGSITNGHPMKSTKLNIHVPCCRNKRWSIRVDKRANFSHDESTKVKPVKNTVKLTKLNVHVLSLLTNRNFVNIRVRMFPRWICESSIPSDNACSISGALILLHVV